jgi:hypothetical protein
MFTAMVSFVGMCCADREAHLCTEIGDSNHCQKASADPYQPLPFGSPRMTFQNSLEEFVRKEGEGERKEKEVCR